MKLPAVILCVAGGVVLLAFFALRTHDEDDKQVQADGPGLAQPPSLGLSNGLPDTDQGSITTGAPSRRPRSLLGSGAGATTAPPSQEAIRTESKTHDVSGTSAGETPPLPTVIASTLQTECRKVAEDLAGEESRPREDLLAMYGRSSAASGRFDLAAAAYAMFLEEFGTQHPYAERVAMRLADCLAPLDLDSIDVAHTPAGPQFHPQWRMGYSPRPEHLRQAVDAYELAAELASDDYDRRQGLLRLGWVHRALDNWAASTEAWDRCAESAPDSRVAVQVAWLAAENLAWTGQPGVAAGRLRQLAAARPYDARSRTALDRAETLEAEARRTGAWLDHPVASFLQELKERVVSRTPTAIYRSVARWLENQNEEKALLEINEWVAAQEDWPPLTRIEAHYGVLGHLLSGADPEDSARTEAVSRLRQVMLLAPDVNWEAPAGIECARLLRGLGQYAAADQILAELSTKVDESGKWAPRLLSERIQLLLDSGDQERAEFTFHVLMERFPHSAYTQQLAASFTAHE